MQNSKKAKTDIDPNSTLHLTAEQIEKIQYLAETLDGQPEKYLMKFPETSVAVCQRLPRGWKETIKSAAEIPDAFGRDSYRMMADMLYFTFSNPQIHEVKDDMERHNLYFFWQKLFAVVDNATEEEMEGMPTNDTELVPIVFLQ